MPGVAEMYMGFMRTGTELMLLFLGMIMVPSFLGLEGLTILDVVVWAYGFFHANHLASLSDEEFAKVEDNDIFGMELFRKGKKKLQGNFRGIAILLIILGVWLLWRTGVDMLWSYRVLPEYVYELLFTISDYWSLPKPQRRVRFPYPAPQKALASAGAFLIRKIRFFVEFSEFFGIIMEIPPPMEDMLWMR